MTVEPGFGGQTFMPEMMSKLQLLQVWSRQWGLNQELEVDGGIDPVTCKTVIESGANVLVAGSSIYSAEDIPFRIRQLRGK